jgi:hypothetical protein
MNWPSVSDRPTSTNDSTQSTEMERLVGDAVEFLIWPIGTLRLVRPFEPSTTASSGGLINFSTDFFDRGCAGRTIPSPKRQSPAAGQSAARMTVDRIGCSRRRRPDGNLRSEQTEFVVVSTTPSRSRYQITRRSEGKRVRRMEGDDEWLCPIRQRLDSECLFVSPSQGAVGVGGLARLRCCSAIARSSGAAVAVCS